MARYPGPKTAPSPVAAELYRQATAYGQDGRRGQVALPASVRGAVPYTEGTDPTAAPAGPDLTSLFTSAGPHLERKATCARVAAALSRRWAVTVQVADHHPWTRLFLDWNAEVQVHLPSAEAARLIDAELLSHADTEIALRRGRLRALGRRPPRQGDVASHRKLLAQDRNEDAVWRRWVDLALADSEPVVRSLEELCKSRTREAVIDWQAAAAAESRTPGVRALLDHGRWDKAEPRTRPPVCTTPTHRHYRGSPLPGQVAYGAGKAEEFKPLLRWWRDHREQTAPVLEQMVATYGCFAATAAPAVLAVHLPQLTTLARTSQLDFGLEARLTDMLLASLVALHAQPLAGTAPRELTCPFCGVAFLDETLSEYLIRRCGPPRWCPDCARDSVDARFQDQGGVSHWTTEGAAAYLRAEQERTGMLPLLPPPPFPPAWLETCPDPLVVPPDGERDAALVEFISVPTRGALDQLWPGGLVAIWLGAGLAELVRTRRGVISIATDGHRCRSLLERYVDDWLSAHGIEHTCEPLWPTHPTLNPGGRRRADWLIEDQVYVEMAGMLDDPIYAAKMAHKRQLAEPGRRAHRADARGPGSPRRAATRSRSVS
jgi:hypothetical protein